MRIDLRFPVTALALCVLAACSPADNPSPAPAAAPAPDAGSPPADTAPAPGPALTRQSQAPDAAEGTARPASIDSQPGPGGSIWNLTRASVTGQILTVQFDVQASDAKAYSTRQKIEQVSLIDDATSERYSVLQDDSGRPMASPVTSSGSAISLNIPANGTGVVWFRFPALPAESTTVSLSIPEVGPFDAVPVSR